jgi:hypothetical protein
MHLLPVDLFITQLCTLEYLIDDEIYVSLRKFNLYEICYLLL